MSDLLTQAGSLIGSGMDEQSAWTHVLADTQTASTPEICEALAYVLMRLENEGVTVRGEFAAVVVEATLDVDALDPDPEDFVEPARLRYIRYNLAQRLVEHPGLSFEAVQAVIVGTLKWVFVRSVKSASWGDESDVDLKHMLWMLSRTDVVDVSTLGTVWRFFANLSFSTLRLKKAMNTIRFNRNCPLPVILDFYVSSDKIVPLEEEDLFGRMVEAYPDLDGLPFQMMMDVVATQPLPDGWFVDTFPLQDNIQVLAPAQLTPA